MTFLQGLLFGLIVLLVACGEREYAQSVVVQPTPTPIPVIVINECPCGDDEPVVIKPEPTPTGTPVVIKPTPNPECKDKK